MDDSIDTQKIGVAAAEMMESLSDQLPDGSVVTDAMVIACVHRPDQDGNLEDENGKEVGDEFVTYVCTSSRAVVQSGLLDIATQRLEWHLSPSAPGETTEDDEDEDEEP